ncbi:FdhD protein [Tenacibaculum sp. MAR_2010_89]|uniref:formate dehydrogenase accessory sulfurtransferase FdhD n=1 Tax=Tenacibaculum sp. MAR_2010_89 TaxID=1250198 RepID=UPI000897E542|nr:formate dehydrogenase accessory sulfurtransferase FdhD [Tenacibaculum sp. MAR_2010_89]SEE45516.1 FdhD protein [Tenacibaculum sp. MAR_2010_89]
MTQVNAYQSIKVSNNISNKLNDNLVIEAPLQININEEAYTVVMRTPYNDIDLITGLLYAEDIYRSNEPLSFNTTTKKDNHHDIINVTIDKEKIGKGYLNKRTLLSVSSCGICGKKEINDIQVSGEPIKNTYTLNSNKIQQMFLQMTSLQFTFKSSGGSHACALFNKNQKLLTCKEDIGRHNAVDKCIGSLLKEKDLNNAKIMLVSGRVSYEIVSKAFFAKIPIIIAVSACSSLAVDFAKEFGICLIGFSRDDKMTIYANPQYINY